MKKALIKVGYACNNNCVFCHSRPFRDRPSLSTAALKARLRAARRAGAEMAVFSGGEPTLRDDLPELLGAARALGLAGGLITNGRRFVYPAYAESLRSQGLSFVYFSFHAAERQAHRASAGTDSLPQTLAALRNAVRAGLDVTVNAVVTRHNIAGLRGLVDLVARERPRVLKLSVVEPKGAALDDPLLAPPLPEAARAIGGAFEHARARHPGLRLACEGLTPCLLPGHAGLDDDLAASGFILHAEAFDARFFPPDRDNRSRAPSCADCSEAARCPGVFTGYHGLGGGASLRPLSRRQANSFVFVKDGPAAPAPRSPRACPARADDPRRVFVLEAGRARPYRTPTGDFREAEIDAALRLGQVYASRDGRHRGLDYGRDLERLEPAALCRGCDRRRSCGRLLRRSGRDAFRPLESALERRVASLRGRILDVGCGSVRFRSLLERRARAGAVSYVGIDPELPDAPPAPGLELVRAGLEEYAAPDGSFDHALLLRSYNHLPRPTRAFARLHRLLKPGGTLTVVDGVPFGLLVPRRPPAARPGEQQHLRNASSSEARAAAEAAGFAADAERPVRPGGGCEWLLAMRKP